MVDLSGAPIEEILKQKHYSGESIISGDVT